MQLVAGKVLPEKVQRSYETKFACHRVQSRSSSQQVQPQEHNPVPIVSRCRRPSPILASSKSQVQTHAFTTLHLSHQSSAESQRFRNFTFRKPLLPFVYRGKIHDFVVASIAEFKYPITLSIWPAGMTKSDESCHAHLPKHSLATSRDLFSSASPPTPRCSQQYCCFWQPFWNDQQSRRSVKGRSAAQQPPTTSTTPLVPFWRHAGKSRALTGSPQTEHWSSRHTKPHSHKNFANVLLSNVPVLIRSVSSRSTMSNSELTKNTWSVEPCT